MGLHDDPFTAVSRSLSVRVSEPTPFSFLGAMYVLLLYLRGSADLLVCVE